ncbi:MAG TPA: RidA family protein [Candidatus Binataceae bacterium]|nr:RidA family protein [Candidatus Binataceae bacterium]
MEKKLVNPPGIFKPWGYHHAVTIEGATKMVFISGQVARGHDGQLIKGDLAAQARQANQNLIAVLAGVGATAADVVKLTTFVVHLRPENRKTVLDIRDEFFGRENLPASSLIGVEALAEAEMLVEIEAIAAVPA